MLLGEDDESYTRYCKCDYRYTSSTELASLPFPSTSSLISDCGDFVTGTNASWPYILEATTVAAGDSSQAAQTFTMNITTLPSAGADFRVAKTTAMAIGSLDLQQR